MGAIWGDPGADFGTHGSHLGGPWGKVFMAFATGMAQGPSSTPQ